MQRAPRGREAKSSTSVPSRATAWARTPANAGRTSPPEARARSAPPQARAKPHTARCSSVAPVRHHRRESRHEPGQHSVSRRSRARTPPRRYASRAATSSAVGPISTSPSMTPRQVNAEKRERRIRHGIDERAHQPPRAPPDAGRRRETARCAGPGRRPRHRHTIRPGARAEDRVTASVTPRECSRRSARAPTSRLRTPQPVAILAPAPRLPRVRCATAAKSTTPVRGECRPAIPRACGLQRADRPPGVQAPSPALRSPGRGARARPGDQLGRLGGDDHLPTPLVAIARARNRRTARPPPPRTDGPSTTPARSRYPRGAPPSCGRSGGREVGSRSSTHTVRCGCDGRAHAPPRAPGCRHRRPRGRTAQRGSFAGPRTHHCQACASSSAASVASPARCSTPGCSPRGTTCGRWRATRARSSACQPALAGRPRRSGVRSKSAVARPGSRKVRGNTLTGEGLPHALDGIEVAYYLVHSMEGPPPGALTPDQPLPRA